MRVWASPSLAGASSESTLVVRSPRVCYNRRTVCRSRTVPCCACPWSHSRRWDGTGRALLARAGASVASLVPFPGMLYRSRPYPLLRQRGWKGRPSLQVCPAGWARMLGVGTHRWAAKGGSVHAKEVGQGLRTKLQVQQVETPLWHWPTRRGGS